MQILFQGGWVEGRNAPEHREAVKDFALAFAERVVQSGHRVILGSYRYTDRVIAERIIELTGSNAKDVLTVRVPQRYKLEDFPVSGRVERLPKTRYWQNERTLLVMGADALVAIGGGKGTLDCAEKAILAGKPVIPAPATGGSAEAIAAMLGSDYSYVSDGDARFLSDLNTSPRAFFDSAISVLDGMDHRLWSRRIFVVHGRRPKPVGQLVDALKALGFEPVVLERQADRSRAIVEKFEQESYGVGFGFVLYTPDDVGGLKGRATRPRARQNVVLEHGYLWGRLGRDRVCTLVLNGKDMDIPSDLHGVLVKRIKSIDRERHVLAEVLNEAGYVVDISGLAG